MRTFSAAPQLGVARLRGPRVCGTRFLDPGVGRCALRLLPAPGAMHSETPTDFTRRSIHRTVPAREHTQHDHHTHNAHEISTKSSDVHRAQVVGERLEHIAVSTPPLYLLWASFQKFASRKNLQGFVPPNLGFAGIPLPPESLRGLWREGSGGLLCPARRRETGPRVEGWDDAALKGAGNGKTCAFPLLTGCLLARAQRVGACWQSVCPSFLWPVCISPCTSQG